VTASVSGSLDSRPRASTPVQSTSIVRDLVALAKPRITSMVLLTAVGGFWLAARSHGSMRASTLAWTVLGTTLIVSGANALNMFLERDTDALMDRTRDRPLPTGRLAPSVALAFGLVMAALAVPALTFGVNPATGLLGSVALVSYVLVYTPLKRKTTHSLAIGAVPGAIPPLLGWTAAAGRVEWMGVVLFFVLFFWQIPHFLAIATFRRDDYRRAGLKVLPVERGDRVTRIHIVAYLVALLATTALLLPIGGRVYGVTALVLGAGLFGLGCYGFAPSAGNGWARSLFAGSIVYLVGLLAALMLAA
jgi:protoheme IX farnesyltransferase